MKRKSRLPYLLILMVLAFLVRGAVLFINLDSFNADPDGYRALAQNMRHYGVYGFGETPTAFRSPVYPVMLAAFSYLSGSDRPVVIDIDAPSSINLFKLTPNASIALLHWILGLATVFLSYRLMKRLGVSDRFAFMVGLLVAIDPILLQQSRLVMTETAAAFFAVLLMNLLTEARHLPLGMGQRIAFFGVGMVCGLAALTRPVFLVFGILCFPVLVLFEFRHKVAWVTPISFVAGGLAVLLPWGFRNQHELGRFTMMTTHGGYTLLLANNNSLYDYQRTGGPLFGLWNPEDFKTEWNTAVDAELAKQNLDKNSIEAELLRDDLANLQARKVMDERKADCALSVCWRIGHLWQMLPYRTNPAESAPVFWARIAIGVYYFFELLLAAGGFLVLVYIVFLHKHHLMPLDRSDWLWYLLLIAAVGLPHLFYWTNMRMRAPLVPVIAMLVLFALKRIGIYWRYRNVTFVDTKNLYGRF